MTDTAELTHLDESTLEDECNCESSHGIGNVPCSKEVTHVATAECFLPPALICANAYEANALHMKFGGRCMCGSPARDCWTIRPV